MMIVAMMTIKVSTMDTNQDLFKIRNQKILLYPINKTFQLRKA